MNYDAAKAKAVALANETGVDHGVEKNAFGYSVFRLPARAYRTGFELRCEVVSCDSIQRTQEGHGHK